jgi:hypothetical protein
MALGADVAPFDRLHAELVGDFLCPRLSVQRIERRKMRRLHPLLHFRLVALRALVGPDDLCRVRNRGTNLRFICIRKWRRNKESDNNCYAC